MTHNFKRGDVIPHDLVYLADETGTKATLAAGCDVEFSLMPRQGRMSAVFNGSDNKDEAATSVLIVKGPLAGRSSFYSPDSGGKVSGLVIGWGAGHVDMPHEPEAIDFAAIAGFAPKAKQAFREGDT